MRTKLEYEERRYVLLAWRKSNPAIAARIENNTLDKVFSIVAPTMLDVEDKLFEELKIYNM